MAPKFQAKSLTNKIHTSSSITKEAEKPQSSKMVAKSNSLNSPCSINRCDENEKSEIFDVIKTYRSSLPPLRVPRQVEESIIRQYMTSKLKNFEEDFCKPSLSSVSIRQSQSDMIDESTSKARKTSTEYVEKVTEKKRPKKPTPKKSEYADELNNRSGIRLYENISPQYQKVSKYNERLQRNVSFDLYANNDCPNQHEKHRREYIFRTSDFV